MAGKRASRTQSIMRRGVRALIPPERIGQKILLVRGHKVLVDADLAEVYGVTTKRLNEAVKRNADRFPMDFMFRLSDAERDEVVANCDHLARLKFSSQMPLVFTEQGVAMLSSVLRSPKAVAVNVEIMRAFVKLRHLVASSEELTRRIEAIDAKFEGRSKEHAAHIEQIYALLDELINPPEPPKKSRIGFRAPDEDDGEPAAQKTVKKSRKSGGYHNL
jgi:hypothetical protein